LTTSSTSKPTVETAYPLAQKCSPVKFLALPPNCLATAIALLPLRKPITDETAYFGGI